MFILERSKYLKSIITLNGPDSQKAQATTIHSILNIELE